MGRNPLDIIEEQIADLDFSRKGNFSKSVLLLIGLGSLHMTINFIPALVQAFIPHTRQSLRSKDFVQVFTALEQRGLVKKSRKGREAQYVLTVEGREELDKFRLEIYQPVNNHKQWDGKWRMIIFDIPEERAATRKFLRSHLFRIGFVQKQKSVWVYPYPCHDLVKLVRTNLDLHSEVLYAVVEKLESDKELRKHFTLK